jgi:hypothetical protein
LTEKRFGGFTAVAHELTTTQRQLVTRQGVYAWWRRRDKNGFPDRKPVPGKKREQFDLGEVSIWYVKYMATPRQGRKRIDPDQVSGTRREEEGNGVDGTIEHY